MSKKEGYEETERFELKKTLGLHSAVAFIVGTMVGGGIFVTPKGVLQRTGSVGLCLIIWALGGVLAMLGGLCYAELGSMIPLSGGEYSYVMEAFGRSVKHRFLGKIPAFLVAWIMGFLLRATSYATLTQITATYGLSFIYGECPVPNYLLKMTAIILLLLIAGVNCQGVNWSARLQNAFMFVKVLALLIIIGGGLVNLFLGKTQHFVNGFDKFDPEVGTSISNIALSFYSSLAAYDGWNNTNYVTEELKNKKHLIKALVIGVPMVTVLYVLTNVSYFTVMSPEQLLASDAVAVTWAEEMLGVMSWIIPVSVCFSTFGAANGLCFSAARIANVAGRDSLFPRFLSYVHVTRYTPSPGVIATAFVGLITILVADIYSLIDFNSFLIWMVYGSAIVALLVMRRTRSDFQRPIKVPLLIPVFMTLVSVYLVVAPILADPDWLYFTALIFIVILLILYVPLVYYGKTTSCLGRATMCLQLLLEVAPPDSAFDKKEESPYVQKFQTGDKGDK